MLIFIGITLLTLILFYLGTGKDKMVMIFSLLWIFGVGIVSYNGYFTNTSASPPRFLWIPPGAIVLSIFVLKQVDKNKINTNFLLAIHSLRLPIELVLYQLFLQKQVPILMTFKGWNFDIVIGISAILLLLYSLLVKKQPSRPIILAWNVSGLALLATIVAIAILSSPLPIQQLAFDQPNVAVLKFPFTYLPAFIVPFVFLSHILAIQKEL